VRGVEGGGGLLPLEGVEGPRGLQMLRGVDEQALLLLLLLQLLGLMLIGVVGVEMGGGVGVQMSSRMRVQMGSRMTLNVSMQEPPSHASSAVAVRWMRHPFTLHHARVQRGLLQTAMAPVALVSVPAL